MDASTWSNSTTDGRASRLARISFRLAAHFHPEDYGRARKAIRIRITLSNSFHPHLLLNKKILVCCAGRLSNLARTNRFVVCARSLSNAKPQLERNWQLRRSRSLPCADVPLGVREVGRGLRTVFEGGFCRPDEEGDTRGCCSFS